MGANTASDSDEENSTMGENLDLTSDEYDPSIYPEDGFSTTELPVCDNCGREKTEIEENGLSCWWCNYRAGGPHKE
jgi:hypothetical protein